MNVTDAIRRHARVSPEILAILRPDGQQMPYRDFDVMVDAIARRLGASQIAPSQTVALRIADPYRALMIGLALARIGAAAAPNALDPARLDALVLDPAAAPIAGVRSIFSDQGWWQSIPDMRVALPVADDGASTCRIFASDRERGRFVALSHATIAARLRSDWLGIPGRNAGTTLFCTDMTTCSAWIGVLGVLTEGGTLGIATHVDQVLPAISTRRVDRLVIASRLLQLLVAALPSHGVTLPSLKRIEVDSPSVDPSLLGAAAARLPSQVYAVLRSVEAGGFAIALPGAPDDRGFSAALLYPDAEADSASPGASSALRVRTPGLVDRYCDAAATAVGVSADGWVSLAMTGRVDDGVLYLERGATG